METEEIERHAMIRSRMKLTGNEEKPTKFFYTAENGELKTEDKEILKITKDFYSDLYKKVEINEQEQENFVNKYDNFQQLAP